MVHEVVFHDGQPQLGARLSRFMYAKAKGNQLQNVANAKERKECPSWNVLEPPC